MLHISYSDESITANGDDTDDVRLVETTVFELCGRDEPGLLGRVTEQLILQGCDVRSAAVRILLLLSHVLIILPWHWSDARLEHTLHCLV
jgi:hypothetical protein